MSFEHRGAVASARRWSGRLGLSVADQAIASGANFLLNVLLVRWLTPSEYGAFGIVFSLYLLYYAVSGALVQEPLAVLGPARYPTALRQYIKTSERLLFVLVVGVGGMLLVAATLDWLNSGNLAASLLGLALAAPTLLLYHTRRRAAYVIGVPSTAFRAAVVYAVTTLATVVIVRWAGYASGWTAFLSMGLGGAAAAWYLRVGSLSGRVAGTGPPAVSHGESDGPRSLRAVARENFQYGRWVLASAGVYWLATFSYQPLVSVFSGLGAGGVYRAMLNLVLPLTQVMTALGLLLLPHMSGRRAAEGVGYIRRSLGRLAALSTLVGLGYMAILLLAGPWVIRTLYGGGYYDEFLGVALLLGATQVLGACRQAFYIGLKAMEKPSLVFFGQAAGAAVTLSAGIWMIMRWGVMGAGWGQLLSTAVEMAVLWMLYQRYMTRAMTREGA